MLWVGVAIAAALVLLLVVRAMGSEEDDAPKKDAGKDAGAKAGDGAKSEGASAKDGPKLERVPTPAVQRSDSDPVEGRASKPGKSGREDEEPEGTKVASVPPPAAAEHLAHPKVHVTEEEVPLDFGMADEDPTGPQALILVTGVGRTDPGRRRKHNEDAYLVLEEHAVFAIADGMGGYAAGEVASQLAVDVMAEAFRTDTFAGTPDPERPKRGDELCQSIEMANTAILTQARANEAQAGMGTTVVSARFSPNKQRAYIAHVGDSRAYRIRAGEIKQLTTDHTLGAAGITGPSASKLSRAVGIMDTVEVELTIDAPKVGDHYLLCSDGLSKMVPDEMIKQIVLDPQNTDLTRACERLVETANERGGRDNVSVILVHVELPHPSQRPPEP